MAAEDFRSKFPGLKVANRGISGDTTRGLLTRVDTDVLALHPSAVVILIGTNDIGLKESRAEGQRVKSQTIRHWYHASDT